MAKLLTDFSNEVPDLAEYLLSDDARDAPFWQLQAVAACRWAVDRPMSLEEFVEFRSGIPG